MQDCLGNELKVGDKVTYPVFIKSNTGYITGSIMCKGIITKLCKVMVEVNGKRRSVKHIIKVGE